MHIPKLIPALLLVTLAACNDPSAAEKPSPTTVARESVECKPSVHPFWTKFRAAVLAEDMNALAAMTEFPLVIQWSDGQDSYEKSLERPMFATLFPQLLNAAPGAASARTARTMKELVRATPVLDKTACGNFATLMTVDRWQFYELSPELSSDDWRLAVVEVADFPAAMKRIPSTEQVLGDTRYIACNPGVHPFWTKFRAAVLKEDWNAVADLTDFPFQVYVKGNEKLISRPEFIKALPQFLKSSPGKDYFNATAKDTSMKTLIKETPTLDKRACGEFEILLVIGLWHFSWTSENDWRLRRVDVHEPTPR